VYDANNTLISDLIFVTGWTRPIAGDAVDTARYIFWSVAAQATIGYTMNGQIVMDSVLYYENNNCTGRQYMRPTKAIYSNHVVLYERQNVYANAVAKKTKGVAADRTVLSQINAMTGNCLAGSVTTYTIEVENFSLPGGTPTSVATPFGLRPQ
jgi:hypothetical protein